MAGDIRTDAGNVIYDVCVIGSGMIGSSAARHLSESHINEDGCQRILLIGPVEPKVRTTRDIFGAWYDEGRITRILDPDPVWCHLSQESIKRYCDLEKRSGCEFYSEVGYLIVGPKGCQYNELVKLTGKKISVPFDTLDRQGLKDQFPYLSIPDSFEGILRRDRAGHISPRNLVHIQQKLAKENGCDIEDDIVCKIEMRSSFKVITTDKGHSYQAKRVLVATGAFTTCRDLLPNGLVPKVNLASGTVILVRISEGEAKRLKNMPSFYIIRNDPLNGLEADDDIYGLPPILYPDGNYYIKMGHGKSDHTQRFTTPKELKDWYHGRGNPYLIQKTKEIFRIYFPDIIIEDIISDNCVTVRTPTDHPYIDMIDTDFGVALGGNGNAAKCCDELGKIAAEMIANGKWNYEAFPADVFHFQSE